MFDGYTTTRMHFDNKSQLWRMEVLSDPNVYATTEIMPVDYPLGSHVWDIHSENFNGKLELNLNSCDDFESFGCNDGACISIKERCVIHK